MLTLFWTKAQFVKHGKGAFIYYVINFNRGLMSYCIELDLRSYLDLNLRGQKFKIAITLSSINRYSAHLMLVQWLISKSVPTIE